MVVTYMYKLILQYVDILFVILGSFKEFPQLISFFLVTGPALMG